MRAVQLRGPADLAVVDREEPEAGPGQVLLRVLAAGVCQTDLHMARSTAGFAPVGTVLGHESAGEVVAVGPGVDSRAPGSTVVVYPVWTCGTCPAWARGRRNACRAGGQRLVPAPTPGVSPGVNGGMAE